MRWFSILSIILLSISITACSESTRIDPTTSSPSTDHSEIMENVPDSFDSIQGQAELTLEDEDVDYLAFETIYIIPRTNFPVRIPEYAHFIYKNRSGHIAIKIATEWRNHFETILKENKKHAVATVKTDELGNFDVTGLQKNKYYLVAQGAAGNLAAIWVIPFQYEGKTITLNLTSKNASYAYQQSKP